MGMVGIDGMLLWKPVDGNATGTGTVMEMWMQTATGMWGQLTAETRLFGVSLTMGVWLMILYDMLRVFRAALPHGTLAVNLEDLLYWLGVSVYLFRQMYMTTYGSIRWFFILGVVCGIVLANFILSIAKKIYGKMKKSLEKRKKNR